MFNTDTLELCLRIVNSNWKVATMNKRLPYYCYFHYVRGIIAHSITCTFPDEMCYCQIVQNQIGNSLTPTFHRMEFDSNSQDKL